MEANLFVNITWIKNKIFWLLLLIPLCFKIEILPGVIILPQEILLPFFIILYFLTKKEFKKSISVNILPYMYLLLGLLVTIVLTFFSFFQIFDPVGLLKLFKYSIYVVAIIVLYNYRIENFVRKINTITIITILLTLLMFYLNKQASGNTWSTFIAKATYVSEFMPTGFSNRIYNLHTNSFVIYTGNHGIYGSYLALVLFFNLSRLINNIPGNKKLSYVVVFLTFFNIMLLTSRETFLLIIVTLFSYSIYYISFKKFNLSKLFSVLICFVLFIILLVGVIIYFDIELSIINKISISIQKFRENGGDGSVDVRFNTWIIIFIFLFTNPWRLFMGTGFNPTLFRAKLDEVASNNIEVGNYVGIPESFFIQFLSYGGILSLLFAILFMFSLFNNFFKRRDSTYGKFLPFYIIGLFVTNNTGASILAELLMTQLALIYIYIINYNGKKAYSIFDG